MAKKRKQRGVTAPPANPGWRAHSFNETAWLHCLKARDFYALHCSFQSLILDGCPTITDRKVYRYDIACARHVLPLCDSELLRETVELAEEAADNSAGVTRFLSTYGAVQEVLCPYGPPPECVPKPPLNELAYATAELTAKLAHTENLGAGSVDGRRGY